MDGQIPPKNKSRSQSIVGQFIKRRREALNLSQRALGMLFSPPVTTQFISNVERGITPLPPSHIKILSQSLKITESELLKLLEHEFSNRISLKLGQPSLSEDPGTQSPVRQIAVDAPDSEFVRRLYEAYKRADDRTRMAFVTVCETLLNIPKSQ